MRLWSLHPKYLDARGLVALWREGLLAQAVLAGKTKGYKHHPQLTRFQLGSSARGLVGEYLRVVCAEAASRGYRFDSTRISRVRCSGKVDVTRGQLAYEWIHLLNKLEARDPRWRDRWTDVDRPLPHPLFRVRAGGIEDWERAQTT